MPRGRIIHPDFWTDSKMVRLSPLARLLFIGSWNYAHCDQGHLTDDPEGLVMKVLPRDNVNVDELLGELFREGVVVREELPGGRTYLREPNFGKWQQKDDGRWATKCPICREHGQPRQTTYVHDRGFRGGEGKGGEEKRGEVEVNGTRPPRNCPQHPNGTTTGCFACRDARLAQADWDAAQKNKPTPTAPPAPNPDTCRHVWTDNYCAKCLTRKEDTP